MIYSSPFPAPSVPRNLSVSQFLVQTNPDDVPPSKVIISDFDRPHHALTYGDLRTRAAHGAAALHSRLGMQPGDVVCILGHNAVNWMLLCHCILWGGGAFCAVNPLATPHELAHYFAIAKPRIVAVDAALLPRVATALAASPAPVLPVPQIIVIQDGHDIETDIDTDTDTDTNSPAPQFPRDFVSATHPPAPPYNLAHRDNRAVMAGMCFSSGTSGQPKAVMLSHHALIAQLLTARATSPALNSAHTTEVFYPPFAHIYGLVACVLMAAWAGHYAVAMKHFAFAPYLERCAAIRATVLRLVPATATRLAKDAAAVRRLDLTRVRSVMVAGAALAPDTVRALQSGILHPDAAILNGYGMTECTITTLRETRSRSHPGSLGRVAAGTEIRIVDDDMRSVAPGADGQCLVRGPTMFMGYRDNEAETRASFTPDGWFLTGDIVRMDGDGFLWMTGRMKELIKFRGSQVAPAELEAVLLAHPLVSDAGVCGVYSKELDTEVPVGAVTLVPSVSARDRDAVLAQVRAFLDDRLSPYKRLRGGLFHLDAIPKGATGKLQRRDIPAAIKAESKPKL